MSRTVGLTSHSAVALIALIVQNTSLVIVLKQTFRENAVPYSATAAVLASEVLKFSACVLKLQQLRTNEEILGLLYGIRRESLIVLPSVLYVVQNNLLYYSVRALSPIVYMVCLQLKTLTTAVFSVLILGTKLSSTQVLALLILMLGVVLVQVSDVGQLSPGREISTSISGLVAVTAATVTSGLAGVLLEKIYKSAEVSEFKHNLWTRNLQLSFVSLPVSFAVTLWHDYQSVVKFHVFRGFDSVVLLVVVLQGVGGIIIAYVMKFASSMLKCFAVAVSICLCAVYASLVENRHPVALVWIGICLVNASVFLFTLKPGILHAKQSGSRVDDT